MKLIFGIALFFVYISGAAAQQPENDLSAEEHVRQGRFCLESKNADGALFHFSRAAGQGHPEAQFMVAESCYKGRGVEKDTAEAKRWCRMVLENKEISEKLKTAAQNMLNVQD